jgi:hypothetical protein
MLVFVVMVVFQTAFHLEIYQNNVFFFLKKIIFNQRTKII